MTIFWAGVALLISLRSEEIRKSYVNILAVFASRRILTVMGLMCIYIIGMVYGLYRLNLWNEGLLKNTFIWSILSATIAVFQSNKAIEDGSYFRKTILESIGLMVFLEFVLNFYDFGLVFEFIAIPILATIGAMIGYLEAKKEHKEVKNIMWSILFIYLAIATTLTIKNITADYHSLVNCTAILELLQPPLMTILFLPFVYFLVVYFAYERAYVQIGRIFGPDLLRVAKKTALREFGLDRLTMMRWISVVMTTDVKNVEELVKSVKTIKRAKEAEKAPEEVPYNEGWSPYVAKKYLLRQGILPGCYNPTYEGSWFAFSQPLSLDGEYTFLGNRVSYSLKGTERFARKLKLTLDIDERATSAHAHEIFAVYCGILTHQALSAELPNNFLRSIIKGKNLKVKIEGSQVSLTRHDWAGNKLKAYELCFEIVHPTYKETGEATE